MKIHKFNKDAGSFYLFHGIIAHMRVKLVVLLCLCPSFPLNRLQCHFLFGVKYLPAYHLPSLLIAACLCFSLVVILHFHVNRSGIAQILRLPGKQ